MKKKIISILLIVAFMLMLLPKMSLATNFNNSFYSFYIPNKYKAGYENVTSTSSFKSYYAYEGSDYTSISFGMYKSGYLTPYTQTDVNNRINSIKKTYNDDKYFTLTSVTGKLIELNGVKRYKVTYYTKYNSSGTVYGHEEYELRSDNYYETLSISTGKSFIGSSEYNKIINSFKIKDTVTKSRGIPYTDVASNAWYYNAVKYVYNNKIVSGYNAYTYGPEDKLTRGMIVTILYRMEGSPNNNGQSKFSDVKSTEYYAKAVKWATDKGIVHGYGGTNKFGPNDNIIRQDLAGILRNYAKYKGKNVNVTSDLTKFKDYKKVDSYAKTAVQWAVGKGVITGNSDGTLNPKGNASRAEAAAMIQKYCNKVGR